MSFISARLAPPHDLLWLTLGTALWAFVQGDATGPQARAFIDADLARNGHPPLTNDEVADLALLKADFDSQPTQVAKVQWWLSFIFYTQALYAGDLSEAAWDSKFGLTPP